MDNELSISEQLSRDSIVLPDFKSWNSNKVYDYEAEIVDYESMEQLNRTTNQARKALFKTNETISKYERLERTAKLEYERAHRRELLKSTAKTADERRARADLMCEDLENEWLLHSQVKDELVRFAYSLRQELSALQALGNNLRQQLRVL